MKQKKNKIAIDLFSGCGGLTDGLKRADFSVIGAVEFDKFAADTFRLNHSESNLLEADVRNVDQKKWMRELGLNEGDLDLLAGCPPCQGFSSLRTKNGFKKINDERNNLILEMYKFVTVFKPKSILIENVPGLSEQNVFFDFIKMIEEDGYLVSWEIHDVQNFGVPQRRRRLVLIAGKGFAIPFPNKVQSKNTVRKAIGNLLPAGNSGDPLHDIKENRTERIKTLISKIPKDGGSRIDLPREYWLPCHLKANGFKDVYGRMSWDNVSPTITGGCFNPSKGRFLHPCENRTITLREAALLQTFGFNFKVPSIFSKSAVAQMIGNAIPPEFVKMQAREISLALDRNRK
jgi:DNA (cytosine-5)-methyltransferase 1